MLRAGRGRAADAAAAAAEDDDEDECDDDDSCIGRLRERVSQGASNA